ncbi:unnamed protein product [Pieris macdunnoughi]|uniref:Uncharacterized protein n=1 Tax=Pieris macdunnoughi TaxID=345717 RepID=A0A821UA76_9NEOP|nr:unnamed protein product [Pieris macdunnoughi]
MRKVHKNFGIENLGVPIDFGSQNNLTLRDFIRDNIFFPDGKSLDSRRVKRQLPGLEGNQVMVGTFQAIMRPLGNNIGGLGNEQTHANNETIL